MVGGGWLGRSKPAVPASRVVFGVVCVLALVGASKPPAAQKDPGSIEIRADAALLVDVDTGFGSAFNIARIDEIEKTTQHDVIAFTTSVAEIVGPSARWLHFGLTSSDVVDTAQAIQMVEACDLILTNMTALASAIQARADEHKHTPMIGRTHGVHAEPMTFGLKLALWYADSVLCAHLMVYRYEQAPCGTFEAQ